VKRLESKTKFYKRWYHIRSRCEFKWDKDYKNYGAKGIRFEWKSFDEFKKDMNPSFLKHVAIFGELNTTIDRINSKGNYSNKNCRWTTRQKQQRNKKTNRFFTYQKKTLVIADWAKEIGCSRQALRYRLNKGMTIEECFKLPFNHGNVLRTPTKNN